MVINYGLIGFSGTTGWIWRLKMVKFSIPKMANRSGKWWSKHWGHPVFRDIFWGITALILQCKRSLGFNSQGVIYREILELMQDTLSPSKWMAFFLIFSCHDFLNLRVTKIQSGACGASRKSNSNCWNFGTLRRSKRRRWREGHFFRANNWGLVWITNIGTSRVVSNVNAGYKPNKQTGYFSQQKPVTQGKNQEVHHRNCDFLDTKFARSSVPVGSFIFSILIFNTWICTGDLSQFVYCITVRVCNSLRSIPGQTICILFGLGTLLQLLPGRKCVILSVVWGFLQNR